LQLIIAPIKVHPDARLQGRSVTSCHMPAPSLFVSHRVTPPGEYTSQIEGPAVDKSGNLYVVNFHSAGTIGKVAPGASHSTLFATLHHGRIGSGIRFDRQGRMYIADFKKNNVLVIAPGRTDAQVYFHSDDFNQPNDLAIAADGTLYASDPDFPAHTGQIWKITRNADGTAHGEVMQAPRQLRQTNGSTSVRTERRSMSMNQTHGRFGPIASKATSLSIRGWPRPSTNSSSTACALTSPAASLSRVRGPATWRSSTPTAPWCVR
jgi:hypothetical protein